MYKLLRLFVFVSPCFCGAMDSGKMSSGEDLSKLALPVGAEKDFCFKMIVTLAEKVTDEPMKKQQESFFPYLRSKVRNLVGFGSSEDEKKTVESIKASCLCLLPNGDEFVVGDTSGRLRVFNIKSGSKSREIATCCGRLLSLRLSDDKKSILSLSAGDRCFDNSMKKPCFIIKQYSTKRLQCQMEKLIPLPLKFGGSGTVRSACFSLDGKRIDFFCEAENDIDDCDAKCDPEDDDQDDFKIVRADKPAVGCCDLDTGKFSASYCDSLPFAVCAFEQGLLCVDEKMIVRCFSQCTSKNFGDFGLIDYDDGERREADSLFCGAEGLFVVGCSYFPTSFGCLGVDLLFFVEGKGLRISTLHELPIVSISGTPDGRSILSLSADGEVKIWDLEKIRSKIK